MVIAIDRGADYVYNGKSYQCPIDLSVSLLSGRWKTSILCKLLTGKKRYGELKKLIPEVNHKMLTEQLRELEDAGIVSREVYPVVPPKVEYELTELGEALRPAICSLEKWGKRFQTENPSDSTRVSNR
ncbi:DNA-binding HxlR family transcriptional regulator [Paenibacillus mucilaginosus]|uniref:winged helix-turn-helix transcriptional regulator n=1 Tax=Paenibacillus mucilaginosus TaxID=61624 RepID=UPI003D1DE199